MSKNTGILQLKRELLKLCYNNGHEQAVLRWIERKLPQTKGRIKNWLSEEWQVLRRSVDEDLKKINEMQDRKATILMENYKRRNRRYGL